MKPLRPSPGALALLAATLASAVVAQTSGSLPSLSFALSLLNALPPPPDDPMLDASGNVVVDPTTGQPMSDPNEKFHQVKPRIFDPAQTHLVQSGWLAGTGCPTNATTSTTGDAPDPTPFTDPACPTGDPQDERNEGLLLAKTGPTANFAAAVAELKKVRGTTVTELGYDIRKAGGSSASPLGSHCGAGAPRFNLVTANGDVIFIGCNSPPADVQEPGTGWVRLRWHLVPGVRVNRIQIVFDEGQDASGGPDQFGAAFLDNIDVNGTLVGRGDPP